MRLGGGSPADSPSPRQQPPQQQDSGVDGVQDSGTAGVQTWHPKQQEVSQRAQAVLTPASHVEHPAEQPLWQVEQLAEQPAWQEEHPAATALPQP